MHTCILACLVVLAVATHTVSAASSPTCLSLGSAATVGWKNSTKILDYVPTPFRSNCGYLSLLTSSFCDANCKNPRACCEAACGWNGAGCGCLTGKFPSFIKSIPIDGAEPLKPDQLSQSTCSLGSVYSGSSCSSIPATGSSICNRVKPASENATCSSNYKSSRANALTSLMKMLTFPASFNITTANADSQLKALISKNAAVAVGVGHLYDRNLNIVDLGIEPKLVSNANLLKVTLKRGSTQSTGRYMLAAYSLKVKDVLGVTHKLGNYWASVTFSPCSNSIESVYLPEEVTANQVQSFITTFPQVSDGKKSRSVITFTDEMSTMPLQAAAPPPPPKSSKNSTATLATVGSGLVNGTNAILNSTTTQNATYVAFSNSTFACPGSTLDNMQFCDGFSGSSTYDMSDTGIVSDTCTGLCADGAWDDIADFTCDYGCTTATVEASCSTCQSTCSASCSSCTSGCSAACSTCQAGVEAACDTCQVGCCYGCQSCTEAIPESCCCKVCYCITGCCESVCTPAIPSTCTNAQWCTCSSSGGGPCDYSVCDSTCDCSSTGSACGSACNCNSACASTCNYVCPDCSVNCQDSCESGLGSVGMEYSYSANFILDMGGLNMTGIASSQVLTNYTVNQTNPSAQFGASMSWQSLQVKVGFSATATPSYGAPVIPWQYITTTITQSTFNVLNSTFVTTQDCLPTDANNNQPTGKLTVSMPNFQLSTTWVPWQDVANVLQPWESIFGSTWIDDAAQAMVVPINNLLNDKAAGVVSNLLNPRLAAYDWGTYTCG